MNPVLERVSIELTDPLVGTQYGIPELPREDLFIVRDIAIPRWQAPTLRNFAQMAREIRNWTGWSIRALADAVDTSHPTMGQILEAAPGSGSRHPDLLRRLEQAHDVVGRVYLLADRDSRRTASTLAARSGERSAVDYLAEGKTSQAYLAAIAVLRPRETGEMLAGDRPAQPGRGTVDYLDPETRGSEWRSSTT